MWTHILFLVYLRWIEIFQNYPRGLHFGAHNPYLWSPDPVSSVTDTGYVFQNGGHEGSFEIFQCTSDKRRGLAKRHISNYHVCGNPWEHVKLQILIQEAWVDPPGEVDGAGPQITHWAANWVLCSSSFLSALWIYERLNQAPQSPGLKQFLVSGVVLLVVFAVPSKIFF